MAFQPIFDIGTSSVFAQEALLRGKEGQSAGEMLALADANTLYSLDQLCRSTAIRLASDLGIEGSLSINFMPNAIYEPENCLQVTLQAAERYHIPVSNIILEMTETESVRDTAHLVKIFSVYRSYGFRTALDDFGSGYAGLSLLSDVVPDIIKIDRHLIRNIDRDRTRQALVHHIRELTETLGVVVIAEGVETPEELRALSDLGIVFAQGYLLARPRLEGFHRDCQTALP